MYNFDANASFGLLPEVEAGIRMHLPSLHNPSSLHRAGQSSRAIIEEARRAFAQFTGLQKGWRIIFTSGATESNNTVLNQLAEIQKRQARTTIITATTEHHSVLEPCALLEQKGYTLIRIPYDPSNGLDYSLLEKSLSKETALVSLMYANNETGNRHDLSKISLLVKKHAPQAFLHSDAVQALGKIPGSFSDLGVDAFTFSAHKIGALSGLGVLALKEHVPPLSFIHGGPQETHERAGTENVLGIYALHQALLAWQTRGEAIRASMRASKEIFIRQLIESSPSIHINQCKTQPSLENTLSVTIPGIRADDFLVALDSKGIYASSGSACASGKPEPSHVLLAMGLTEQQARATIRFSFTGLEPRAHIEEAAREICNLIKKSAK